MKLLIFEYVTAGGMGRADRQALLGEAEAMLQALVNDFSTVSDIEVHVLRCPSLPPLPRTAQVTPHSNEHRSDCVYVHTALDAGAFGRVLAQCDVALVLAPESNGILHALSREVESRGVALLGSTPEAIACAGDKWLTAQALAAAGIAQIPTFLAKQAWPPFDTEWVLKPRDGCACEGIQRFGDQRAARAAALNRDDHWVAQPWLVGTALSLSVLGGPRQAELLGVNRQHLALHANGTVELRSVEVAALRDADGLFAAMAHAVYAAIPGLRGMFGIDILHTETAVYVVEVNPRVTSAYPGLSAAIGTNSAARWLAALRVPPVQQAQRALAQPLPPGKPVPPLRPLQRHASLQATAHGMTLGWDIGGAHLKVAALSADGHLVEVIQRPCALWQGMDRLLPLLAELATRWGVPARHALTMSGEMVDLFSDRQTGVRTLLDAFVTHAGNAPVMVYVGGGAQFRAAADCAGAEHAIASANWLSTADWAARHIGAGIVLDIGSTTTDLLCFWGGRARPVALGDAARLASDELIYTGIARTPLMAVANRVMLAGIARGVMAELFATSADVYRILATLPDDADQHPSADGGPKTVAASISRLARMVGCDGPEYPFAEWQALAGVFRDRQVALVANGLAKAYQRLLEQGANAPHAIEGNPVLVLAGVGRFLAEDVKRYAHLAARDFASIGGLIGAATPDRSVLADHASRCAPAVAVAALAALADHR